MNSQNQTAWSQPVPVPADVRRPDVLNAIDDLKNEIGHLESTINTLVDRLLGVTRQTPECPTASAPRACGSCGLSDDLFDQSARLNALNRRLRGQLETLEL